MTQAKNVIKNKYVSTSITKRNSFVLLDGHTIRGCTPLNPTWMSTTNEYDVCAIDKCNGKIFPESRLHCLHCEGNSCVNQTNTVDVRHPCLNYVKNDQCYSIFEHGKFSIFQFDCLRLIFILLF